jgi:internalin A
VYSSPKLPSERLAIYISYAWGDEKSDSGLQRLLAVKQLCQILDRDGYDVLKDDEKLRPGDWISTFMKAVGRGDHVLIVLSAKYLFSPNCMTELFYIYSRSLGEKEDFLKRVLPVVLDDAKDITDWRGRLKYAEYWKAEFKQMELNLALLGRSDVERYQLIKQWHGVIGDILGFVADVLHPHGFDALVANNFASIREMLKRACAL